ncbi:MAG: DNA repair protein RadA [Clostridia bacterium]
MKQKTVYLCSECGNETIKWQGQCPACRAWNTLEEFKVAPEKKTRGILASTNENNKPTKIKDITTDNETRFDTGMKELNRVLGGGAVSGSFVLVGGEPGIGKSTLLLQICDNICKSASVLYVSGEESLKQIKLRASRLSVSSENLFVLAETDMASIVREMDILKPDVVIIDSIQTVYKSDISSAPGNTTQIKECSMELMQYAKSKNTTIFVVGHVNKDGAIAGPKILEHMVDCVLYFEGEKNISYRMLRAEKNRFGSTNEIGVFEMSDKGLIEIENPSAVLLAGRPEMSSGNCIACTIEGSRPILTEIQALVTKTAFGTPRRTSAGVDYNRMVLLLAILEKRVGLYLSTSDAYLNVVGGLKIDEPAVDLPIALAVTSSYMDKPVRENLVSFGEVGLTGELRAVSGISQRINEAYRLGFKVCIVPNQNLTDVKIPDGIEVFKAKTISDAIKFAL